MSLFHHIKNIVQNATKAAAQQLMASKSDVRVIESQMYGHVFVGTVLSESNGTIVAENVYVCPSWGYRSLKELADNGPTDTTYLVKTLGTQDRPISIEHVSATYMCNLTNWKGHL